MRYLVECYVEGVANQSEAVELLNGGGTRPVVILNINPVASPGHPVAVVSPEVADAFGMRNLPNVRVVNGFIRRA